MADAVTVRRFEPVDCDATARIFFDAVHVGAAGHYDAEQRRAWAPERPDGARWLDRLTGQSTFVAERAGAVVGFMTLDPSGHIDLAFVAPEAMGQGIAFALYRAVEAEAVRLGLDHLTTEASLVARPFFVRQGWQVVRAQTVERRGVTLSNVRMEKRLR
ncbi:MAG: GNAT family N-acetyltransferase [Rhodobiaceae bacterium]|nr:GNAT family N-acetyltransferase [Rhodobiaceae bacterium]